MSTTARHGRSSETSPYLVDRSLATLREAAPRWARRSTEQRIDDLRQIALRTVEVAPDLIAAATSAKGISQDQAGEEWVSGPVSVLRTIRFLGHTLRGIARRGEVPLPDEAIRERSDGQVTVDVLPADGWDRVLYPGWKATVRMQPEVSRSGALRAMGSFYTKPGRPEPAVSVILGAGNVSSIASLDLINELFVEGRVALVKFNPVNDYIGPFVEHAFGSLIAEGFVRTAYGGKGVGEYLVTHPEVDSIHLTGSEQSHDAIVFGSGADGEERKRRNEPRIRVPVTSELGNVSPVVVLPGKWSRRQLRYQAEHVATQLLHNAGYNCNAAKVLILPAEWPQSGEFMGLLGDRLRSGPDRPPYYPGSLRRYRTVIEAGGQVETFGDSPEGLPPTIVGIDPAADHPAFSAESFCRVMARVDLPGDDPASFLARAVRFCNHRLRGTLNATLLVDPSTLAEERAAVDRAVDDLRYGTIGLNLWAAAGFPLGVTPWGAHPGHTSDDIGSGIGFVHNARLIDHPQKTVITAPFVQFPKPSWSVFHRRSEAVLRRVAAFEATPSLWRLPAIATLAALA